MGSKTKLTDTSGKRIPKKPKINETDISVTTNGELFLNENQISGGGGDGTPSAPNGSVQYNNAGDFQGDSLFIRNPTTKETIIGLTDTDLASNLQIKLTGNTLTWDADTTDTIVDRIEQNENILGEGVKGNLIIHEDTFTSNSARIVVGDTSAVGGTPFQVNIGVDDATLNNNSVLILDANVILAVVEDVTNNITSDLALSVSGNTILWDADTTDTIITKLEQSQNLIENGISGSALIWEDFSTQIRSAVAVYDATAIGGEQGNAAITTINTATGDQAAVTTYNDPIEGLSVGVSTQNGNIQTNLSLSSVDGILNYRTEGGVGQEAMVSVTPTETYMTFILDSLSPTYKASLGNGVFSIDDSVNSILYLDIANGQSIFGNVAAASGITVFVDNANGINIQAPESVINIGANGFGNETNLQVDDSTQLITSSSGGVNKNILVGKTKLLPDNTVTSVFEVALPAGGMTGGFFTATIIATDGTDLQAHSDHITYAAVNKAGVYTTQITNSNTDDAIANSSGTLTITWSIVTGTNKITISVNANSSLAGPTITLAGLNIDNNNGHIVTIL